MKRLFSLKRHSFDEELSKDSECAEESSKEIVESASTREPLQRPTWKCFSYQEIFDATNAFGPGVNFSEHHHLFLPFC